MKPGIKQVFNNVKLLLLLLLLKQMTVSNSASFARFVTIAEMVFSSTALSKLRGEPTAQKGQGGGKRRQRGGALRCHILLLFLTPSVTLD